MLLVGPLNPEEATVAVDDAIEAAPPPEPLSFAKVTALTTQQLGKYLKLKFLYRHRVCGRLELLIFIPTFLLSRKHLKSSVLPNADQDTDE
jgi:hypothetical protein